MAATLLAVIPAVACGSPTPASPQGPPPSGYSVTGFVGDLAGGALAGAVVAVVDGPDTGMSTITSIDGRFAMAGVRDLAHVQVTKRGYEEQTQQLVASSDSTHALARFRLEWTFAGPYTLTFTASPECDRIPEFARSRSYRTTIDGVSGRLYLSGATFAPMTYGDGSPQNVVIARISEDRISLLAHDPPLKKWMPLATRSLLHFRRKAR